MMSPNRHSRILTAAQLAAIWLSLTCSARAQAPGGYGAYFQQKAIEAPYGGGPPSSNRYLYDKYFYHRPTVSPYINLDRPDTLTGTAYQSFVQPEVQRREASSAASRAYVQQRKLEGRVGDTRYPTGGYPSGYPGATSFQPTQPARRSTPPAYSNHWYGGWNNR